MTKDAHEQPHLRHVLAGFAVVIVLLAVLGLAI